MVYSLSLAGLLLSSTPQRWLSGSLARAAFHAARRLPDGSPTASVALLLSELKRVAGVAVWPLQGLQAEGFAQRSAEAAISSRQPERVRLPLRPCGLPILRPPSFAKLGMMNLNFSESS